MSSRRHTPQTSIGQPTAGPLFRAAPSYSSPSGHTPQGNAAYALVGAPTAMEPIGALEGKIGDPYKFIVDVANDVRQLAILCNADLSSSKMFEHSTQNMCSTVDGATLNAWINIIKTTLQESNALKVKLESTEAEIQQLRTEHATALETNTEDAQKAAKAEIDQLISDAKKETQAELDSKHELALGALNSALATAKATQRRLEASNRTLEQSKDAQEVKNGQLEQTSMTLTAQIETESAKYTELQRRHQDIVAAHCNSTAKLFAAMNKFMEESRANGVACVAANNTSTASATDDQAARSNVFTSDEEKYFTRKQVNTSQGIFLRGDVELRQFFTDGYSDKLRGYVSPNGGSHWETLDQARKAVQPYLRKS